MFRSLISAALLIAALARALTTAAPPAKAPITPELAQRTWQRLSESEPAFRAKAAENFAADAWSQDDDFFASERGLAESWSQMHLIRRQDVFAVVDQGLRERWPLASGVPRPVTRVAPCRPRALE